MSYHWIWYHVTCQTILKINITSRGWGFKSDTRQSFNFWPAAVWMSGCIRLILSLVLPLFLGHRVEWAPQQTITTGHTRHRQPGTVTVTSPVNAEVSYSAISMRPLGAGFKINLWINHTFKLSTCLIFTYWSGHCGVMSSMISFWSV